MLTTLSSLPNQRTLEKIWMQVTKLAVNKRGEALNPRVLVVYLGFEYRSVHEAERMRSHSETYRQVRGRMLGHCSTAHCKGSDDAFDGTEELEPARWDDDVRSSSTHIVQSRGWETTEHNRSGTGPDVRDKGFVIQTCTTNTCRFDTCHESVEIFGMETRELDLFLTIPALKPNDMNRTLKHVTGEDRELLLCLAENRNCTSYPERNRTIIPDTRESSQQHSTRSGNETRSESQDETHSHEILVHSRFGISETADDVIGQD